MKRKLTVKFKNRLFRSLSASNIFALMKRFAGKVVIITGLCGSNVRNNLNSKKVRVPELAKPLHWHSPRKALLLLFMAKTVKDWMWAFEGLI